MSAPAKCTLPASAINSPQSMAMNVVLPAPFGPMSAWIPAASMAKSMASFATRPPKRLVSPRTRSSGSSATASQQYDEDEQRPEDQHPVLGDLREDLFQHHVDQRTEQRPDQRALPAEDHHDHQQAGGKPVEHRRPDVRIHVGEQRAGKAADRAGKRVGGELVAGRGVAERL